MKKIALVLCLLPTIAWAQLTPDTQALWACANANQLRPFDSADAAAITTSCGTPTAVTTTLAQDAAARAVLIALRNSAWAAWVTYVRTHPH